MLVYLILFATFAFNNQTSTKMKDINALITGGGNASYIIAELKKKDVRPISWGKLEYEYEPSKHKIVHDMVGRVDKKKEDGTYDVACRMPIGLEKLLVKRITEFLFSIPPKRTYSNIAGIQTRQDIADAIEAIYKNARIQAENKKRGVCYYASCEFFTLWYVVKQKNNLYGFDCEYKLKCKTYSPMDGVELYPLFDEYGDMTAMSFEYMVKVNDEEVYIFETYTADRHFKWRKTRDSNDWEFEDMGTAIEILKIPGVYQMCKEPIYYELKQIREELEYTISRNSDVVAYNSAPVLKVSGGLLGYEDKGEAQRIFRTESGGDVQYVSWAQSIEALKYHVDTLLKLYWMQAQMPDVSFDTMKSIGNLAYDSIMTLLMDAHLKVGDESCIWKETLERECNVVKAFLKSMKKDWEDEIDNVDVEHVITPFIISSDSINIKKYMEANGGKALISHLESIQLAGLSQDPAATLDSITQADRETNEGFMNSFMESAE